MATDWYYGTNDERYGPVALVDLQRLVASGEVNSTDLAWTEGFSDWKPVGQVAELKRRVGVTSSPPPLPVGLPAGNTPVGDPSRKKLELPNWKSRVSRWWFDFRTNAKSASQLVAKQVERTKLTTVTLPVACRELGRHLYEDGQLRGNLTSNFEEIDRLNSKLTQLAEKPDDADAPQAISEKARAMAGSAKRTAQRKVIEQKLAHAFTGLGKTAFEQHGEGCGSQYLFSIVIEHQVRLESLDAEIGRLSEVGQGQAVTPKRIVLGGLIVLAVAISWGASAFFGEGSNPGSVTQDSGTESHATLDDAEEIATLMKAIKDADALWDAGIALIKGSSGRNFTTLEDSISKKDQGRETCSKALSMYMVVVNTDGTLPDKATMGRVYGRAVDGTLGLKKNRSVATDIAVKALRRDILPLCNDPNASDIMVEAKRQIKADDRETDEWLNNKRVRDDTSIVGSKNSQPSRRLTDEQRFEALVFKIRPGMKIAQVAAHLGPPDDKTREDLGDLNPAKRGHILEIQTWETPTPIILGFVNGTLDNGGTTGYDIREGFKSKLPANATPDQKAKLRDAARRLGITIID